MHLKRLQNILCRYFSILLLSIPPAIPSLGHLESLRWLTVPFQYLLRMLAATPPPTVLCFWPFFLEMGDGTLQPSLHVLPGDFWTSPLVADQGCQKPFGQAVSGCLRRISLPAFQRSLEPPQDVLASFSGGLGLHLPQ